MNSKINEKPNKKELLSEINIVCKSKLLILDRMDEILDVALNRGEHDEVDEETREQMLWEKEFIDTWEQEILGLHDMERKAVLGIEYEDIYLIKFTLKDVKPSIWRTVELQSTYRFSDLHEVIQEIFDWSDSHLHLFKAVDKKGQRQIIRPLLDPIDDEDEYLDERYEFLYEYLTRKTRHLTYVYDMGDNWEVGVELKKTLPIDLEEMYPVVRKGKRSPPPDDSGGPYEYEMLLKAFRDKDHPEHKDSVEWLDEDFDPEYFDPEDYFWADEEMIFEKDD